ncbi:MAG: response regulator [Proteobacteria bacterium]|nr:response regulator [Pseudomonadota bacterium]MBU1710777.1 response regulator [Pseudomonadota bacterium]
MARILIADDDVQVRTMLREMLERAGYEVDEAADGAKAMKLFRENPYDLVITDIIMPEKEGIETIMELRRDYPNLTIFAISGGGRVGPDNYLKLAQKIGARKTFTKPFDRTELLGAVAEALKK